MSTYKYKIYDINYVVDGDLTCGKEVIIILNGIMIVKPFTKDNVLIRYDMFDQGETSKLDYDYTQEIQVELLKYLLDHLKVKKVNIVGISYGASIALQFAAKYENYINKMVVANVVSKTSKWLKAIGDGWNSVASTRDGLAYYNISIPYIYSPQFYTNNINWMEERKEFLIPLFSNPVFLDAMVRLTKSAETHDVEKDLKMIKVKTLIISSDEDFLTPVFEQKHLHSKLQNSNLVIIPECGHASMYEKPELFTSLVLGFINNIQEELIV